MSIRPFRIEIQEVGNMRLRITKYRWWRPSHTAEVTMSRPPGYNPSFFWVNEETGGGIPVDYHEDRPYYNALRKWHKKLTEQEQDRESNKKKIQHEQYMKSVLKPVKEIPKLPEARVHKGDRDG
jgi:hypothetical protein